MQTISGIHYNFSVPGPLSNDAYFALIRNFRRHSWLLLYLFGASPAVCACFVEGRAARARAAVRRTRSTCRTRRRCAWDGSATRATRRRRSRSATTASRATARRCRARSPARIRRTRRSASATATTTASSRRSLLQIENEFYGTIRPKRRIRPGERPLHALRERGVEYVEVRLMDLDPFRPGRHRAPTRCASSTCSCCIAC